MNDLLLDPEILERFQRLGAAFAIGLLIGVERGWKERGEPENSRTAGVRTFTLIGLLGGVVSLLSVELGGVVLAAGTLAFALVFGGFELERAHRLKISDATPLAAALVVFGLGALAGLGHLHVAAAAAVAAAVILAFKDDLHGWVERLTFQEIRAVLALAAMTVIILPLLPSAPVDPWGAISLRAIWLLTVLIAAISFVGYGAIRILGPKRGPLVAGVAGGMVSSTATVLGLSRLAKSRGEDAGPLIAGAVAANAVMFARVAILAAGLRLDLAPLLVASLGPAALISAVMALWLARRAPSGADGDGLSSTAGSLTLKNPLNLRSAAVFAVLLAAITVAAAALEESFGAGGLFALAAVSGLADVDAVTLSMTQASGVAASTAVLVILVAVAVNTVSKAVLARVAGGSRVGLLVALTSAAALAAGAGGYLVYSLVLAPAL